MATIQDVSGERFDYVIVGGGTAGLTVAARLAEDPKVRVVVLEAGSMRLADPAINVSGNLGQFIGNPTYDWLFTTTPQTYANNRQVLWSRGKVLGGSSAINFYFWSKPPANDINAWEKLGNSGWNWEQYFKYSRKVEGFTAPAAERRKEWVSYYREDSHGRLGQISTSFAHIFSEGDIMFHDTLNNLGIAPAKNLLGGDPVGRSMQVLSVSANDFTRSYSAKAFYLPNKDKPNLKVLCDALVLRIITKSGDGLVAEGVEFEYESEVYRVYTDREVILCAGALKTPQILELSGIGDRAILEPLGIQTKHHLPGVGANLQEHTWTSIGWELDPTCTFQSPDGLRNPEIAAEELKLHPMGEGLFNVATNSLAFVSLKSITDSITFNSIVESQRRHLGQLAGSGSLTPGLKEQFDIQMHAFENGSADCEFIYYPGFFSFYTTPEPTKLYSSILVCLNHPFSRGTIHIASSDPHVQAAMDPRYFEEDIDMQTFVEAFKFARKVAESLPMNKSIVKEVFPGPKCESEEDIREYIKASVGTTFHTIGTASMLPKEQNGVVNDKLQVYGTKNIRIVDLSIAPLHFCAHSQATAYTIAEQAADIIKGTV